MATPVPFTVELDVPPVLKPHRKGTVHLTETQVSLHPELPDTRAWTYDGSLPGPTIETRRGRAIQLRYRNEIPPDSVLPVHVVEAPYDGVSPDIPQNEPGSGGATSVGNSATLRAHTVVHLHGGRTPSPSDGDPESVSGPDQDQLCEYTNDQRARMLWYHDHAMGVTRLNVHAGLAGLYIIRDEEERALHLPGAPYEVPLLIQDRNLETDCEGNLTGQLLHKTETDQGPMEFFGPYTLVNGKLWPFTDVEPRTYRLRLLNGSNARTYRLLLCRQVDGAWEPVPAGNGCVRQIGGDCGLFEQAVSTPTAGLVLGSAERADLLVDFSQFPGETLRLYNTAEAPFNGNDAWTLAPDVASPENRRPYPEVMEFRVAATPPEAPYEPPATLSSFHWRSHDEIAHSEHRLVVLTEEDGMLRMHEMLPVSVPGPDCGTVEFFDRTAPDPLCDKALRQEVEMLAMRGHKLLTMVESRHVAGTTHEVACVYWSAASLFHDATNFMVALGSTEVWKILNLTGDTHPIHVHLADSQPLMRKVFNPKVTFSDPGRDGAAGLIWNGVEFGPDDQPVLATMVDTTGSPYDADSDVHRIYDDQANRLDLNEKALKDTMRANPGELLVFASTFDQYAGRYMYHCHILEHEDREMMRPLVVLPADLISAMPDHGSHH